MAKQEILPPAITSRDTAAPLIKVAIEHFHEAKRASIQVMADLRRLQDASVHLLYGEKNFARWAASTFEGMRENNVRQLCWAGSIALELDRRGLIDLDNPKGIGTTGLRELATVSSTYGDDKMAEAFVTARNMLDGKSEITGVTIEAAMRMLMPPAEPIELDNDGPTERDLGTEYEDDEPQTEYSDKVTELIEQIRDLSWDLPETAQDVIIATEALARQLALEKAGEDQTWIEGTR